MRKEFIPAHPIAKWSRPAARQSVRCPLCGARPGYYCISGTGLLRSAVHVERVWAYAETLTVDEWRRRHAGEEEPSTLKSVVFPSRVQHAAQK